MPLPMPFASDEEHRDRRRTRRPPECSPAVAKQREVPDRQPDHRRQRAPEPAEAVHDLAAREEQREVDGAGDADDERDRRLRHAQAHPDERHDHLPARPQAADQGGVRCPSARARRDARRGCGTARPDRTAPVPRPRRPGPRGGRAERRHAPRGEHPVGSGSTSSTAPAAKQAMASIQNTAWVLPASPITRRSQEGPDEVAGAEHPAEQRQRPRAVGERHERGHERLAGERERRRRDADQQHADGEHERVRGQQRDDEAEQRRGRRPRASRSARRCGRRSIRSACRRSAGRA